MASLNAAATLEQATDFAADFAGATLTILEGATVLVSHVITSFTPSNDTLDGLATAVMASSGAATIAASGTANTATIQSVSGGRIITLSVALTGADLNLTTLTYINGETSTVSSLVITFPAS